MADKISRALINRKQPEVRTYRGQTYALIRSRPYIRRDGSTTELFIWRGHCAECGTAFGFSTPALSSKFEPNRRCREHRRPGVRVKVVTATASVDGRAARWR